MIPKFRAWDKLNESMCDVANIDFMTKVVELRHAVPFYFLPFSEVALMQSTGLKDKNGVEIFEGDIASGKWWSEKKMPYKKKGEVTYANGLYLIVYDSQFDVDTGTITYDAHSLTYAEDVEVFGNIYENPELLEVVE